MEFTNKDYVNLNAYFEETLPETDRQLLEKRLEDEPEFAEFVYQWLQNRAGLEAIKYRQHQAFLKKIDADMPPFRVKPKLPTPFRLIRHRGWVMAAAAIGLLVVSFGWWFFLKPQIPTDEEAALPAPLGVTKGVTADMNTLDSQIEVANLNYLQKNYDKAASAYQAAYDIKADSIFMFYKAMSLIGNHQYETATPILEKLEAFKTDKIRPNALKWYLAFSYAKTQQNNKALTLLEELINTEGGYADLAKTLKKNILEKK